jgi:hypothetical protein
VVYLLQIKHNLKESHEKGEREGEAEEEEGEREREREADLYRMQQSR